MALRTPLLSLAATAALTFGAALSSSVASAHAASQPAATEPAANAGSAAAEAPPAYDRVDSFVIFGRPYAWRPINDSTVIVWATAFDPYLVELAYPSHDMRFVQAIGVSSSGSRVYARFDAVTIRGFRYPIASIFKLSREEARNLTSHKTGNS